MIAALVFVVLSAMSPEETVAKVQATYKGAGDIFAKFEQTYVDKVRGSKRIESGELWAKKDGRVRWSYHKPAKKDFVFNGKEAYFYEPESAQVTVFESFEDSPVGNAVRFLWGQGEIAKNFDAKACDATCVPAADAMSIILIPKEPIAAVERIQLDADQQTGRVRRSVVVDPLGNRTEYVFKDLDLAAKVSDAKFAFTIPSGVSVLRASADEVSKK